MKKIGLICAIALTGMSLTACSKQSYNLKKLRAEHARLLKQSKEHKSHRKTHKYKKQTASSKKENDSKSAKGSNKGNTDNNRNSSSQSKKTSQSGNQTASNNSQQQNYSGSHLDAAQQANVNKGLYPDGTRKPDSFSSSADYQRYNAWYQGYNYDPSTGSLTRMNDQQLNDMRQQMNANGGQNFH